MKDIPDILGFDLEEAEMLLEEEGVDFYIKETKPSSKAFCDKMNDDSYRIIRVRPVGSRYEITVCRV